MTDDELLKMMDSIEFNIKRTIKKLQRKVKWQIGVRFWKKPTEQQQQIINDIIYMPFDLMDYLLIEKYKSIDQYMDICRAPAIFGVHQYLVRIRATNI